MAHFGTTDAGAQVQKITLHAGDLTVDLLTFGAIVQSVRLKGLAHDLTLGSDNLADYQAHMCYYGALIAPVVNRLTAARAPLGNRALAFEVNFNGRHILHSGAAGAQSKLWTLLRASETEAVLALDLPDGEGGFPGNRHIEALFQIAAPASLRMTVTVTSDADTLWNAANHSYWNLDGSPDFSGHSLQIAADHYLPVTEDFIPSGEMRTVDGAFDFRKSKPLTPHHPDLDNCFCLSQAPTALRDVLWLRGQSASLTVATTEPGIQVYDCRHDNFKGLAIEAQGWPDAPNKPDFPQITLAAGETRQQVTEWRFDRL